MTPSSIHTYPRITCRAEPKCSKKFTYSRFLHNFPYYSSISDLLFSHYSCCNNISNSKKPRIWHCTKQSLQLWCMTAQMTHGDSYVLEVISPSRQALQNSFDFPAPVSSRHSLGNSFTCCEAVMLISSLDSELIVFTIEIIIGNRKWLLQEMEAHQHCNLVSY